MSAGDDRAAKVSEWLADATIDLEDARLILGGRDTDLRNVAFLCQQSVEKLIKGFLMSHGIHFPKTHDISRLLDEFVTPVDRELATGAEAARQLSVYAVAARYPEFDEAVDVETASLLVDVTEQTWDLFEPHILTMIEAEERPEGETYFEEATGGSEADGGEANGDVGH